VKCGAVRSGDAGNGAYRLYRRVISMSGEPNFQHSDPRMRLSICEAQIMNSFGDFFQKFKTIGFFFFKKNSNLKNILNRKFIKIGL
jgi:hypothetical protein